MKVNRWGLFLGLVLCTMSASLGSTDNRALLESYKHQRISSPPAHIDSITVRILKTETYISGSVSRDAGYSVDPDDYIEVSVIDPDGKTLSCVRSDYSPKPIPIQNSRFGRQPSGYLVKLDFVPPPSSTIKVAYVRLD